MKQFINILITFLLLSFPFYAQDAIDETTTTDDTDTIDLVAPADDTGDSVSADDTNDDFLSDFGIDDINTSDDASGEISSDDDSNGTFTIHGEHEIVTSVPIMKDYMDIETKAKQPVVRNKIEASWENEHWLVKGTLGFNAFLFKNSKKSAEFDYDVNVGETYAAYFNPYVYLALGFQEFTWGSADKISPIDVLNPKDLRYLVSRQDKIAVLAFNLKVFPTKKVAFDFVYLPFLQKDRMRNDVAEQMSSEYQAIGNGNPMFSPNIDYASHNFDYTKPTVGFRTTGFLENFGFSFSYIWGPDKFETANINLEEHILAPGANIYTPDSISLERNYVHRIGFDGRFTAGAYGILFDLSADIQQANIKNDSNSVRNHRFNYVLGFDKFYGPNDDFYVNFQYSGRVAFGYKKSLSGYDPAIVGTAALPFQLAQDKAYYQKYFDRQSKDKIGAINEMLLQALTLKMEFPFSANGIDFKPMFLLAYYLPLIYDDSKVKRYGIVYFQGEFGFKFNDYVTFTTGVETMFAIQKTSGEDTKISHSDYDYSQFFADSQMYLGFKFAW